MPYVHIDLPAGMSANGTKYQNRGKWYDGDRVRWDGGTVKPLGGWDLFQVDTGALDQLITTPADTRARAGVTYKLDTGAPVYFIGTNKGVKVFTDGATIIGDITPTGFVAKPAGPIILDGYGDWFYGSDAYGTPRSYDEDESPVFNWCFRPWGENLIISERSAGRLYEWVAPATTIKAQALSNSPIGIDCFTVTDQRIVMTAGTTTDPRLIQWSTSENNNVWTPAVTNQAGFQRLAGNGRFREIIAVRDLILLVSETDAHVARYLGPPYIYGFDPAGTDCGTISGAAVVVANGIAVWAGANGFFVFDGIVNPLPCPILDRFVSTLSTGNSGKTVGYVNEEYHEVTWQYQSKESVNDDVDTYISWNFLDNTWHSGTLTRTLGFPSSRNAGPIMVGSDGYVYQHEIKANLPIDDSSAEIWLESGPIELGSGDRVAYVKSIQPDFVSEGAADIYIIGQDRPGGPETTFGPYRVTYPSTTNQPIPTRARGHTIRVRVIGVEGKWALGSMRLDLAAGGMK
jgi:hypothetical protein